MVNISNPVIYLVTNQINGKRYVGVTGRSINTRWKEHIAHALANRTRSILSKAIRKYGKESFDVVQIASCLSPEDARYVESDVIKSLAPEYNQTGGGEFTIGRKLSATTIEKIATKNRGKKRTDAMKLEQSEIKKRMYEENHTTKKRVTEQLQSARKSIDRDKQKTAVRKATSKPVECIDTGAKYSSAHEAAKAVGVDASNISHVCAGRQKTAGGMRFRFTKN